MSERMVTDETSIYELDEECLLQRQRKEQEQKPKEENEEPAL